MSLMEYPVSNKSDKTREIVNAALAQFTQAGFLATSLEKIAASAGIGKSTIYEYYRNKEELFIAAVQEAVDRWFEQMGEIKRQVEDPIERLTQIAYTFLECADCPPKGSQRLYIEILMQSFLEGGVFFKRKHYIRQVHQKLIQAVTDIFLEGVSRGQIRPEIARDAQKLAINFLSFLDGMSLNALMADDYIDVPGQVSFFIDHLASFMRVQGDVAEP